MPAQPPSLVAGSDLAAATDLPWRQARALAAEAEPLQALCMPVSATAGLILAEPVTAALASPAFDCAAMDGFAVAGSGPWTVAGIALAGKPRTPEPLAAGQAVEIGTGAVVPAGTDAVIPYEACRRDADTVTAIEAAGRDHIRRTGEDARPGDLVAAAGRRVTATVQAAAGQAGIDEMLVRPRPRVWLLLTGDEIVVGSKPGPGQVRDSFIPIVTGVVDRAGGRLSSWSLLPDQSHRIEQAVTELDADIVVVTGSSSRGAADHLRSTLRRLGARRLIESVACRPGRPQSLARLSDGRWVAGLPGNPFAGLVAALTVVEPLVRALAGRQPAPPWRLHVTGQGKPHAGGVRLHPVQISDEHAQILPGARSGSLHTVAAADALAVIDDTWTSETLTELLPLP